MSDIGGRNFGSQGGESSVLGPGYVSNTAQSFASGLFNADAPREFGRVLKEDVAGGFDAIFKSIQKLGSPGLLKGLTDQVSKLSKQVQANFQVKSTANVLNNGGQGNTPPPHTPMTNRSNGGGPTQAAPPSLATPMTGLPNGGSSAKPNPWGDVSQARTPGTPPPEISPPEMVTPPPLTPPPLSGPTGGGGGPGGGNPTFGQIRWGKVAAGVGMTAMFGLSRQANSMFGDMASSDLLANNLAQGMTGGYTQKNQRNILTHPGRWAGFNSATDALQAQNMIYQSLGVSYGSNQFNSAMGNVSTAALVLPGIGQAAAAQSLMQNVYNPQANRDFYQRFGVHTVGRGGQTTSMETLVGAAFKNTRTGQLLNQAQIVGGMQEGSPLQRTVARYFGGEGSAGYQEAYKVALAEAQYRQEGNTGPLDIQHLQSTKKGRKELTKLGLTDTVVRAEQSVEEGKTRNQANTYGQFAKSVKDFDKAVAMLLNGVARNRVGKGIEGKLGGLLGWSRNISGALPLIGAATSLVSSFLPTGMPGGGMPSMPGVGGDSGGMPTDLPAMGDGTGAATPSSGNTISQLEGLVSSLGMPYTVTSTYRPGGSSYHARHEAIDIAAGRGPDSPEMLALNKAIASKYGKGLSELIHAGPGAVNIKDGKVVNGQAFYGSSTMAGHHNHVHIAASPQQLQSSGGISGMPSTSSGASSGSTPSSVVATSATFLSEGNTTQESALVASLSTSGGISPLGGQPSQSAGGNGGSQGNGGNGGQGAPSTVLTGAAPKPKVPIPANVAGWINQALQIAGVSSKYAADVGTIISYEDTSFDTGSKNNWDSNAAKGQNSVGLMQTIPSTFAAHAMPGHTNITNPVDNIIAGVRYAIGRYGNLDNVPGLVSLRRGKGYVGYKAGTWDVTQDELAQLHKGEMVVPAGTANMVRSSNEQVKFGGKRKGGSFYIEHLYLHATKATPDEARRLLDMMNEECERREHLATIGGG